MFRTSSVCRSVKQLLVSSFIGLELIMFQILKSALASFSIAAFFLSFLFFVDPAAALDEGGAVLCSQTVPNCNGGCPAGQICVGIRLEPDPEIVACQCI